MGDDMPEDTEDLKEHFKKVAKEKMSAPHPNRPTHTIYHVRDRGEGNKAAWDHIGSAWTNRDGSLSCRLDTMPLDGRFQIRKNE